MSPSQFIPARSSRHRLACIALYRALIREARAIPVPDELLRKGTQNPIPRLVRKAFVRNRTETSYRIVFSALGTGYNIIAHLREKSARDAKAEAGKPPPRVPPPEKPKWPPLLQKVSREGQPPAYVSPRYPVPREKLTGARRVPRLVVTAEGIAFLRQGKPQHRSVVRYVQRATKARRQAMELMLTSKREEAPWAALEDRWDEIVGKEVQAAEARRREVDEDTPERRREKGKGQRRSKAPQRPAGPRRPMRGRSR
ncbi:DNA repair protein [Colletotrichum higginsianum]|nr:DNA repair protein [Colletotrichum higginsianum]